MKEVAFAAYTNMAQNEPGLEATYYYDPPNMTYPNGATSQSSTSIATRAT